MFTELKVENYRCLGDVRLELRPLNVLIGPNGAGKTSVLDVFDLLAEGAKGRLSEAISKRGGIGDLITGGPEAGKDCYRFALSLGIDQDDDVLGSSVVHRVEYSVGLRRSGLAYELDEALTAPLKDDPRFEEMFLKNARGQVTCPHGFPEEIPKGELSLSQVAKTERVPSRFATMLSGSRGYGLLDVGANAPVGLPQNLEPNQLLPNSTGGNLISVLYNLRVAHEGHFQRVVEAVQAGFPDFVGLEFPLVAAGKATMTWNARGYKAYPHQMSAGMLRFLWLTTILLSPNPPSLIAIDEPEVSLHPELLKILAGLLREASQRTQLLVATHSDRLIRWLDPGDVVVMDLEDGLATARRADDPQFDIEKWLAEFSLDELWLMGKLGGRP